MVKVIDQELIKLALCKVVWSQAQKTPLEQCGRPTRVPMQHDQKVLTELLKEFRNLWSHKIAEGKQTGEKPDFEISKRKFFNTKRRQRNWTLATRNLYSSAMSVYMSWDRKKKTITKETLEKMQEVANFLQFLQNSKNL